MKYWRWKASVEVAARKEVLEDWGKRRVRENLG
jgi:hypothetical protein